MLGGSRGIGLEIASGFARDGSHVFINYAGNDAVAEKAKQRILDEGGHCTLVKADVSTTEGCTAIAHAVARETDRVDQLVHSAVMAYPTTTLGAEPSRFAKAVSVNGLSLLYITQALEGLLIRGSTVFYLTSRGGRTVVENYAAIGVSKALAESLVRYMAVELAPSGIRINCIAPGIVETEAVRAVFGSDAGSIVAQSGDKNPSGRGVQSDDYTELMRFLASPAAEYITGQTFFVNGGANLHA
ncbi:SDR family NAD(P)-dependent oxidoreductase [Kineobactrum sediminis]|uniref:SDR family NAD(P)-dependent oxidoreductase n=1 Tax=Kineobactrum sediminis TaxID=1905677 RepID=UPI0024095BA2|nr:SDR family oxidoreductase [Kineobactrum sediminis]